MFRILVHADVREEMLERSDVMAAFDTQERQEKLRDMLAQWRGYAGLTRASLDTLTRYSLACGVKHPQILLY